MDTTDEDILMSPAQPASVNSGNNNQQKDDLGDMTFCMSNYAKEALKMMFMMRQHHMLTDCILEVDNELFHVNIFLINLFVKYLKMFLPYRKI